MNVKSQNICYSYEYEHSNGYLITPVKHDSSKCEYITETTNPKRDANYALTASTVIWHNTDLESDDAMSFMTTPNLYVRTLCIMSCKGAITADLSVMFPNLVSLKISETRVEQMPHIGGKCTNIYCDKNSMTSVPYLPERLQTLYISRNELTSFDAFIPWTTTKVILISNGLTELPDFPPTIDTLDVYDNKLTKLPKKMPTELRVFNCDYNQITKLPDKMENVQELKCRHNVITHMPPKFHKTYPYLKRLYCGNNPIERLDYLPKYTRSVMINNTKLRVLPQITPELNSVSTDMPWFISGFPQSDNYYNLAVLSSRELSIMQKARELYSMLHLRDRFHRWLWRAREKTIRRQLHPDVLTAYLESQEPGVDLDAQLDEFFENTHLFCK